MLFLQVGGVGPAAAQAQALEDQAGEIDPPLAGTAKARLVEEAVRVAGTTDPTTRGTTAVTPGAIIKTTGNV